MKILGCLGRMHCSNELSFSRTCGNCWQKTNRNGFTHDWQKSNGSDSLMIQHFFISFYLVMCLCSLLLFCKWQCSLTSNVCMCELGHTSISRHIHKWLLMGKCKLESRHYLCTNTSCTVWYIPIHILCFAHCSFPVFNTQYRIVMINTGKWHNIAVSKVDYWAMALLSLKRVYRCLAQS